MLFHAVVSVLHFQLLVGVHAGNDDLVSSGLSFIAELHGNGKPSAVDRLGLEYKHTLNLTFSSQSFSIPALGFG